MTSESNEDGPAADQNIAKFLVCIATAWAVVLLCGVITVAVWLLS
jgi:hypothetical protein